MLLLTSHVLADLAAAGIQADPHFVYGSALLDPRVPLRLLLPLPELQLQLLPCPCPCHAAALKLLLLL